MGRLPENALLPAWTTAVRRLHHTTRFAGLATAALTLLTVGPATRVDAATYTVRPGDTLYRVARDHGTDPTTLQRLNRLTSDTVTVGQRLQVPDGGATSTPAPVRSPATPTATVRPAGTVSAPRLDPGKVSGPVAWAVQPPATVASFIGGLPGPGNLSGFGDLLPLRTFLKGLTFDYQTYNNCGPSALSAVLGFYRVKISQDVIRQSTRPDGGYMQVSAIAPELARFGLRTLTIRNGQLSQIKRLLALGIPVIVLQWYDRPGHINHFRVVRGYDDQAGVVWVSDSMVGPVAYLSYASFDALWNTQGRKMFPVYPNGYDPLVRQLL
ncbi:LysM peptidoglycan-binding domain-containing protein [Deinococcus sonorensis]|uniref:LysM peptidoglycan-binding domain-containing protein n=2 Tax=Deinococcus sonorensis TaxID=309891 RepID=A0AAU7U3V7_9DEIO